MKRLLGVCGGVFLLAVAGCGSNNNGATDDLSTGNQDLSAAKQDGPVADLAGADASKSDAGKSDGAAGDASPTSDAGPLPCANTGASCGAPGACVDCATNTTGTACVAAACGCNSSTDCPTGSACDAKQHTCSPSCANGLVCNGGCCDGANCVVGTDNGKCGADGNACLACAGGTPTCSKGSCSATCAVGNGGANCGNGFCCDANNTCQAVGNGSCGATGAACVDCAKSNNGPVCLQSGSCGCNGPNDCPMGQACKAGVCGTACDANDACNGGCCNAGVCAPGTAQAACAVTNAKACVTCVANAMGSACVSNNNSVFCGCSSSSDCPVDSACNTATHLCGAACDTNTPCNGGCCTAAVNGTCAPGTSDGVCGNNGGVCSACAANKNGSKCEPVNGGGQCGCVTLGDCNGMSAGATACVNGICSFTCDMNNKCPSGCCSAMANGTCLPGTTPASCGGAMMICADCTMSAMGHFCRAPGVCGCNTAADCPMGQSCNGQTHVCTPMCGLNQPCNGGCCAGTMCAAGTMPNACGAMNACVDCTMSGLGHVCIGGACGCNTAADCGPLEACDPGKHVCTNVCNGNQLCNGGCCSAGACVAGTLNSACGTNGGACVACANGTPTCTNFACTNACGNNGNGACDGGFCCSANKCVDGTQAASCGFNGVCANCTNSSTGTKCETGQKPYFCGCDVATDCIAAVPKSNSPGQACDTQAHNCTNKCRVNGVTLCNGGCCTGDNGTCVGGGLDASCGVSGGLCNSCAACTPGPHCNVGNGSCGCDANTECFQSAMCTGGGKNEYECNLQMSTCCIPGVLGFKDNGNPANCCVGTSTNGVCDCIATGKADNGNAANCCTLDANNANTCVCIAINQQCGAGYQCCSGHCTQLGPNTAVCTP